jgi:hypothetical protein
MKKAVLLFFFLSIFAAAHSATVNWNALASPSGTGLVDSSGAALSSGNWLRIGFFALSDSAIIALASPTQPNLATLNGAFREFDSTTVGGSNVGFTPGIFSKASTVSLSGLDAGMPGHQIVIWALKGTLGNLSSVTQQAIFYEPSASNASWVFPTGDLSSTTIDINQAKGPTGGGTGVFLAGSYQANSAAISGILGGTSGAVQLQGVAPVPEPSTFAIGALTAFAAAGMRRRRRE